MPILQNISQLAVCPPDAPQSDAGLISNAALVWKGQEIQWIGRHADLPDTWSGEPVHDCGGRLVVPGLIDCHTHLCFGGWRGDEFGMRLQGRSYQEIAAAGGGISSTVAATRATSQGDLKRKCLEILERMLQLGVTTVECKSGYGLSESGELKQLEVYRQLRTAQPLELVPTFLGAHIVPKEFKDRREEYIELLCGKLIPAVAAQALAAFCDVFVEEGAYTVEEAERILTTARDHGLGLKVHADQLSNGGGARLAARMGAVSAEHLEYIDDDGIDALAESDTVAVSLPLASMYLRERYVPARKLLDKGVGVAVATDFNPGSSPSYHLPLAMLLACLHQHMTPEEVLMGVTTVAARAVGQQARIGSLREGFQADIAIIDAPDLNHWMYHFQANACHRVIKNGKWV